MATPCLLRPIQRQLDAYEEEWKRDHDVAMRCYDLETLLRLGIGIYDALEYAIEARRLAVSRGESEWSAEEEGLIKQVLRRWLELDEGATKVIERFAARFGRVEFAEEFRATTHKVKHMLDKWVPPTRQTAPGLLAWDLSEEEAARLEEIQAASSPRLRQMPRPL